MKYAAVFVLAAGISMASWAHSQSLARQDMAMLQSLAEKGDAAGQYQLGYDYHYGIGVKKDSGLALLWWRKSAAQGYPQAMVELGTAYNEGWGVKANPAAALGWYRKASDKGNGSGKLMLGVTYAFGLSNAKKDPAKAELLWHDAVNPLRIAAENGDAMAECDLGTLYAKGWGVTADRQQAFAWQLKAADQDNPECALAVFASYRYGMGVAKDDAKALAWLRVAAEHNQPYAQVELGKTYALDKGALKDNVQGYMWFDIAHRLGVAEIARPMALMAALMKPEEITEALAKSQSWRQAHIAVP